MLLSMQNTNLSLGSSERFKVNLISYSYYHIILQADIDFEIEDVKKIIAMEKNLGAKKLPVLISCQETTNTNTELMSYISKNENNPYSSADAFVISSTSQSILANFYMKVNKPERPTKFFKKETEALEWLKQFMPL